MVCFFLCKFHKECFVHLSTICRSVAVSSLWLSDYSLLAVFGIAGRTDPGSD